MNLERFKNPQPCRLSGRAFLVQQEWSLFFISLGDMSFFIRTSAIAPETTGADMEVPLFTEYPLTELLHDLIYEPFTISSGFTIHSLVGPLPE